MKKYIYIFTRFLPDTMYGSCVISGHARQCSPEPDCQWKERGACDGSVRRLALWRQRRRRFLQRITMMPYGMS